MPPERHMDPAEWPSFAGTPEHDELPLIRPTRQTVARYLWWNGEMREAESQHVHLFANALHYGSAVFDNIRCYPTPAGHAAFRLRDHVSRLLTSAAIYGIKIAYSADELVRATLTVARENHLQYGYIRPFAFFGEGSVGLVPKRDCHVNVFIGARELGAYLGEEGLRHGIRATISSWRKIHHTMLPTTVKASGHYGNCILAAQEAVDRGFDDAILLNHDGTVAEATGENVFFVKGGELFTNDATSSILPGFTRHTVLELALREGLRVHVRAFTRDELLAADEVFLTGTAAEVTPVREIDGRMFHTGPRTIGARLQKAYLAVVCGRDPTCAHWLTQVD